MNTKSIAGAARVICEAMGRTNAVPATIAVALDANGLLNTVETAAELERLRLLQNAQPAKLSEAQVDALADAGNAALNDHYHDDLCHCSDWPESCASRGNYFAGSWDTSAFSIGMAAVIGAWEAMRAPVEVDEIVRLRAERDAFRDQRNGVCEDNERLIARAEESGEARLRAENATRTALREVKRLRARVAELEAANGRLVADRDAQIVAWLGKKAREYGTSNRESRDKGEAVSRMADKLSRGAVPVRPLTDPLDSLHPFEPEYQGVSDAKRRLPNCKQCGGPATDPAHAEDVTPQVQRLRALLAGQRAAVEDPHDSPLHHTYRLGHDLPEVPHA